MDIRIICRILIKVIKNTIQIKVKKNVFDDMIADMKNDEKINKIVNELFIRGAKWNIYLAFIMQSYFKAPNYVRLNTSHFLLTKVPIK